LPKSERAVNRPSSNPVSQAAIDLRAAKTKGRISTELPFDTEKLTIFEPIGFFREEFTCTLAASLVFAEPCPALPVDTFK
jgi:hypothetical protein